MPPGFTKVCCGCIHWAQLHCLANSMSPSSIKFEPSDSSVMATGFSWKYHVCHLKCADLRGIYLHAHMFGPVICQLWQLEWIYSAWGMERNSYLRVLTVRLVPSLSVFLCVILKYFCCIYEWSFLQSSWLSRLTTPRSKYHHYCHHHHLYRHHYPDHGQRHHCDCHYWNRRHHQYSMRLI